MKKNSKEHLLSSDYARERLSFDRDSGQLTWLPKAGDSRPVKIFNSGYAGKSAGVTCPRGYRYVRFRGFGVYSFARLCWLIETGAWPKEEMDHIDNNPSNNRLANLREASRSENGANRRRHVNNTSGFKGVSKKRNTWIAQAAINGNVVKICGFKTPELAYQAYLKLTKTLHGEFAKS